MQMRANAQQQQHRQQHLGRETRAARDGGVAELLQQQLLVAAKEALSIAIVGGGIGGLALALALHRKGIHSTV